MKCINLSSVFRPWEVIKHLTATQNLSSSDYDGAPGFKEARRNTRSAGGKHRPPFSVLLLFLISRKGSEMVEVMLFLLRRSSRNIIPLRDYPHPPSLRSTSDSFIISLLLHERPIFMILDPLFNPSFNTVFVRSRLKEVRRKSRVLVFVSRITIMKSIALKQMNLFD